MNWTSCLIITAAVIELVLICRLCSLQSPHRPCSDAHDRQLPAKEKKSWESMRERILFPLLSWRQRWENRDRTPVSISEVTAKRTNLLLWVSSTSDRSAPCQPVRKTDGQREALPAERCPRCHGLVWEVTDSVCVSVWRRNKTAEKSRGRSLWPFVLPRSISLSASDNNLKRPWSSWDLDRCVCVYLSAHMWLSTQQGSFS